ncbi:hypothetical protein [Tsukamurella paurometabola]|uniref:DUF2207 domain-containing protein n=1 Tax=Tsukamurella paurometabola TaxID=2061 RepID=A0ABS5NDG0_TSUPA|nr:hypothetical protein [Tsukamurella paurometabola]MBS4102302.1 hypothetical protein [Tsukamurella paurometabola]
MESSGGDEALELVTSAAAGQGLEVTAMTPSRFAVRSADARVIVDVEACGRLYRVTGSVAPTDRTLGRGDELAGTYDVDTGATSRLVSGRGRQRQWTRTFHPDTRHFDADPSGRIDAFLAEVLTPAGWSRRWSASDRKWFTAMVVLFLGVFGILAVTSVCIWVSGSPWVGAVTLAVTAGNAIRWAPGLFGFSRSTRM